jgi:hypothetical protein
MSLEPHLSVDVAVVVVVQVLKHPIQILQRPLPGHSVDLNAQRMLVTDRGNAWRAFGAGRTELLTNLAPAYDAINELQRLLVAERYDNPPPMVEAVARPTTLTLPAHVQELLVKGHEAMKCAFECIICFETLTVETSAVSYCGHNYCRRCLEILKTRPLEQHKCAQCRTAF